MELGWRQETLGPLATETVLVRIPIATTDATRH
jgi:hypothetical protein